MLVPNMLLMAWVSFFFPGFVLSASALPFPRVLANDPADSRAFAVRLPFGMTEGFREMLQRGINLRCAVRVRLRE